MFLINKISSYYFSVIKRGFDVVAVIMLITLFTPIMIWIAYRIWREDGVNFIFTQTRIGLNGKPFNVYKFRTMVNNAEFIIQEWEKNNSIEWQEYIKSNFKLYSDPRVLKVGIFLRQTSLDELPQLFNVLIGDMSLVGPRPLMPRELDEYGDKLEIYKLVRPGITGLWQVSGRSETTFRERVALDQLYIHDCSFWGDILILLKTVKVVVCRVGAY